MLDGGSSRLADAPGRWHVQFGSIIKAASSAPQSDYPRQMQLGMKLIW
jgi:hypothetical protein